MVLTITVHRSESRLRWNRHPERSWISISYRSRVRKSLVFRAQRQARAAARGPLGLGPRLAVWPLECDIQAPSRSASQEPEPVLLHRRDELDEVLLVIAGEAERAGRRGRSDRLARSAES